MNGTVISLDIGGTKVAAGLVEPDGAIVARASDATPAHASAKSMWAVVAGLIDSLDGRATAVAVGCGCGGPMETDGRSVSPLNIPAWRRFPLRDRLATHTGLPAYVDNDAKALALGEGRFGAARGVRDYIGMVVSTGIGGGIVLDGRLLDGDTGNAGHVGHVIVEPQGRMCPCGSQGCVEAEASGTAIAAITGRPAAEADRDMQSRCGTLVGRAIATSVVLLDLRLAVVAGSVALGYRDAFFTAAQAEVDRCCRIEFSRGVRVVPGALGSDGPLVGAATVAFTNLERTTT
jgi:glucokinase